MVMQFERIFGVEIDGVTWRYTGALRYWKPSATDDHESVPRDFRYRLQQRLWRPTDETTGAEYLWVDVPEVEGK